MKPVSLEIAVLLLGATVAACADDGASAASYRFDPDFSQSAVVAANIARANTGGRVLDVKPVQSDEPMAYQVRLLVDPGRVRTVVVETDSGRLR